MVANDIRHITIKKVKIAKRFLNAAKAIVGCDGEVRGTAFQLRIDNDPIKGPHVNVQIGDARYAYVFPEPTGHSSWFDQVLNNLNGGAYCNVPHDPNADMTWTADNDNVTCPAYIDGMKRFLEEVLKRRS